MATIPTNIRGGKYTIEDNTFKSTKVQNPARKVDIEIGDAKQTEFYPQYKTKHWNNECNFSIRLVDDNKGTVDFKDDKVEYTNGKRKVRLYEKETGDEDGGFEFDITLEEKPKSNVLKFTIQSKELDFFYQPELTEEEKKEGSERPENVIGSYAVYHKSKKNNTVGGKEYRTGKAFHIYRPYAEDKTGKRVWCDLNIKDDVLTVTIPQKFLDTAVYPVLVDPTFGYTTAGGSEATYNADVVVGCNYTNTTGSPGGTVTEIKMRGRVWSGGPQNSKAGIYEGTDYLPSQSGIVSINSATEQWWTYTFSSGPTLSASTRYIPVVHANADSTYRVVIAYDSGSTGDGKRAYDTYSNFESSWNDPITWVDQTYRYSIYATYTAGSSPDYTLTASAGSYTLTGKDVGFKASRKITASKGTYTLTGNDTSLEASRKLTAEKGEYTLTGNDAGLTYTPGGTTCKLLQENGDFLLLETGDKILLESCEGPDYTLTAETGSYALTGNDVTFTYTPNTGNIKYWDGSAWQVKIIKRYDGSSWTSPTLKRYDGSSWQTINY